MTHELVVDVPAGWWLSSNQRLNRHRVAERVATLRDLARVEARRQGLVRGLTRVRIVAHLTYPTTHRRDPNNAHPTTKALLDGLVDYGLVPDDDSSHVIGPDHRFAGVGGRARHYGVRLVVENLEGTA